MRRALAAMTVMMLVLDGPAVHAGGYRSGYSNYGYGYSYPSYSYQPYNNYYNSYYYPVQPVVVQQNLIPAYVFQSAAALTPPVQTSTTVTTTRQTATTTTTAASQAAVATTAAGVSTAGAVSGASLAVSPVVASVGARSTASVDSVALEDRIAERVVAKLQAVASPTAGDEPPVLQSAPEPAPDFALAPEHVAALRTSCFRCHGATAPKAHLSLFDAGGNWSPSYTDGRQGDRATIYDAVSGSPAAMPKGGAPLAPDVVEALRLWAGGAS